MKKTLAVIIVAVMIMALASCGKKDSGSSEKNEPTKTAEVTKEAEPTKEPETTPEPTKEPEETPAPTEEPEPTSDPEPTDEPDDVPGDVDALGNPSWYMDIDKTWMRAKILGYSEFLGDNLLVTIDFYDQYALDYDVIDGKNIGDVIELNGKNIIIKGFYTQGDNSDFNVMNDSYTDGCRVVVAPEDPEDFYTPSQLDIKGYYMNPEYACFGFVNEGDTFYGYDDWAWDDCYVPEQYVSIPYAKLVVSPSTVVRSAYSFDENGELVTFTGPEYLQLRDDEDAQTARGVKIHQDVEIYVTEIKDSTGRSTGEIESIQEIYSP